MWNYLFKKAMPIVNSCVPAALPSSVVVKG